MSKQDRFERRLLDRQIRRSGGHLPSDGAFTVPHAPAVPMPPPLPQVQTSAWHTLAEDPGNNLRVMVRYVETHPPGGDTMKTESQVAIVFSGPTLLTIGDGSSKTIPRLVAVGQSTGADPCVSKLVGSARAGFLPGKSGMCGDVEVMGRRIRLNFKANDVSPELRDLAAPRRSASAHGIYRPATPSPPSLPPPPIPMAAPRVVQNGRAGGYDADGHFHHGVYVHGSSIASGMEPESWYE